MTNRRGLLVVNRLALLRMAGLSEEAVHRYRGFDGEAWPEGGDEEIELTDGLADPADLPRVDDYLRTLTSKDECEVIGVARDGRASFGDGWTIAGFDLGYYESDTEHFSMILNEVLTGKYPELRRFGTLLNAYQLIPNLDLAQEIMRERNRIRDAGADVEDVAEIEPIAIFLRS